MITATCECGHRMSRHLSDLGRCDTFNGCLCKSFSERLPERAVALPKQDPGRSPAMTSPDPIQEILDELATKVHNLSPGDIGSSDRVLVPIAQAHAQLKQYILDEVIGEDEGDYPEGILANKWSYPSLRNALRAQQRARLGYSNTPGGGVEND